MTTYIIFILIVICSVTHISYCILRGQLREAHSRNKKLLAVIELYSENNLVMVGEIARLLCKHNTLSNMSCRISPEIDKHGDAFLHIMIHNSHSSVTHHFRNLNDTINFLYSRAGV